jgi:cytidyltransferase-like protein
MKNFIVIALCSAFAFGSHEPKKRVWVDGIYDLAHYGHQRSFEKARAIAAEHFGVSKESIHLIAGVNGGNIKAYKREPVMSLEQRVNQVKSFKGVDEVISDTSITFDEKYIDQYRLDLVMHGDDFSAEKAQKYYGGAIERGKFKMYPYEDGISTTYLINRATRLKLEALLDAPNVDCEKKEAIRTALDLISDVSP